MPDINILLAGYRMSLVRWVMTTRFYNNKKVSQAKLTDKGVVITLYHATSNNLKYIAWHSGIKVVCEMCSARLV